eukprot:CAMPEP_0115046264 /NCGR_PEP_ID=MMETSP0216-20121206/48648_1 /TAXON_ID=223996 /ORGANISM="Protocruzia adherens, Strain Boccale" /LENGTH=1097 /DNA_ID=CAMNT_0002429317 /DNA_START=4965 /DNA_END=8258 /DNA_ORIENTATION=-
MQLLDQVVQCLHQGSQDERAAADKLLNDFKELPTAWTYVDFILENSQSDATKFFSLTILDGLIKSKWTLLPEDQKEGIKTFIVELDIKIAGDEENTNQKNNFLLSKLNHILVGIIRHEWTTTWKNFIPELCGSSRTNQSLCENNMTILRMLSEEIFDFSKSEMTSEKTRELKQTMTEQFSEIYSLCKFILQTHVESKGSVKTSLVRNTLRTLGCFMTWIPLGYIFETDLIESLITNFLDVSHFRTETLQCLTEIAGLKLDPNDADTQKYNQLLVVMFSQFMRRMSGIIPDNVNLANEYHGMTSNVRTMFEGFCQHMSLFLSNFFQNNLELVETTIPKLENNEDRTTLEAQVKKALIYLVQLTDIPEDEIFKINVEYWNWFAQRLYNKMQQKNAYQPNTMTGGSAFVQNNYFNQRNGLFGGGQQQDSNLENYREPLSNVRYIFVSKMVRPEEVLISVDENGNVVHTVMKDTEIISLYETMRETLIYLTHLDPSDMEDIMNDKLSKQLNNEEWSWKNLNSLCWAIGSISGAMSEDHEKRFLIRTIKDLLNLCEGKRGKDNKAVVASNIMYVVGQYPRFLKQHWKFLKTVVKKLFEFMHELHPGVQDMACETFLKISKRCKEQFVIEQERGSEPYIYTLIRDIPDTTRDLENHQKYLFYESLGLMIAEEQDNTRRELMLFSALEGVQNEWTTLLNVGRESIDQFKDATNLRRLVYIFTVNDRMAKSVGHYFYQQLGRIFMDMINVYQVFSDYISSQVQARGDAVLKTTLLKQMKAVKSCILRLICTYCDRCRDIAMMGNTFLPHMNNIAQDYANNNPNAREAEVLRVYSVVIEKMQNQSSEIIPDLLQLLFIPTLQMIKDDFQSFPEHRVNLINLIKSIIANCSEGLFASGEELFKSVVDTIVWAFKHEEPLIAENGLDICQKLLNLVAQNEQICNQFYQLYHLSLLKDIFYVLTDSFHLSGFKHQTVILQELFRVIESGQVSSPVASDATNNKEYVINHMAELLASSFQNLVKTQIETFLLALFNNCTDKEPFKTTVRDFLVTRNAFSDSNDPLHTERKNQEMEIALKKRQEQLDNVPGLKPQYEVKRELATQQNMDMI